MSEQTIYNSLRAGGLSHAGTCAMMGNMACESALLSNNVQDNCTLSDRDYTYAVDNGLITRWQFMADSFGYGLCQWTFSKRKDDLYMYARSEEESIGDEAMQCAFCIFELKRDFAELYSFLCTTGDLENATRRICAEYERPAVNNFNDRIAAAQRFYNNIQFSGKIDNSDTEGCNDDSCPIDAEELVQIEVRALKRGDTGRDVFLLQCGLSDMGYSCGVPDGDFGIKTESGLKELRDAKGLSGDIIADQIVWQIIIKER